MYTDENKSIFTYLKEDAVVFINDVSRLKERCENYINEFKENYKLNLERGLALKQQGNLLYHYSDLEYLAQGKKLILNMLLTKSIKDISVKSIVNFESREIPSFNGKLDILAEELTRLKYNGHKVVLATNTYDRAKKLNKELLNLGIETVLSRKRDVEIYSSQVVIVVGNITSGFQYKSIKFDVITDKEMIGSNKRAKTSKSKNSIKVKK
ncbi:transcription-repair coupling factor domain protein [[Clostridium] sordellii ATCC 9714]|nr:transcription-repair coupling factor domain protein [[Clostridium] sordellii ATCC 9714] [Paeniclostridium sordellii ATCC 9714]